MTDPFGPGLYASIEELARIDVQEPASDATGKEISPDKKPAEVQAPSLIGEKQGLALLTTGMDLFNCGLLDSEITSILSAMVSDEPASVKEKLLPIGWNGTQFTRAFTVEEFKSCFASTSDRPVQVARKPTDLWWKRGKDSSTAPHKGTLAPRISAIQQSLSDQLKLSPIVKKVAHSTGKVTVPDLGKGLTFNCAQDIWTYVQRKKLEIKWVQGKRGKCIKLDDILAHLGAAYAAANGEKVPEVGDIMEKSEFNFCIQRLQSPIRV